MRAGQKENPPPPPPPKSQLAAPRSPKKVACISWNALLAEAFLVFVFSHSALTILLLSQRSRHAN